MENNEIDKIKQDIQSLINKFNNSTYAIDKDSYFNGIKEDLQKALDKLNESPRVNKSDTLIYCTDCNDKTKLDGFRDRNWQVFHSGYICPKCANSRWGNVY